jgi:hypothetical protein
MSGQPTSFNCSKAVHQNSTVPSSVLFGANSEDESASSKVYKPLYGLELMVKIENEEEDRYVPSTGSKTLLSSCSHQDDDSTEPNKRDPSETAASAIKAFLLEDEKILLNIEESDNLMKWE